MAIVAEVSKHHWNVVEVPKGGGGQVAPESCTRWGRPSSLGVTVIAEVAKDPGNGMVAVIAEVAKPQTITKALGYTTHT
jgi:hypothetical protein